MTVSALAISVALVSCDDNSYIPPTSTDFGRDTSGDTSSSTGVPHGTDTFNDGTPTDTDPATACQGCAGFSGVDILVVVDNSVSMGEEQQILATGFYTLINTLVEPVMGWPYSAAGDVRVGIVSSDLGMQYGTAGQADPNEGANITGCGDNAYGDDGAFMPVNTATNPSILVDSNRIKCDPGGGQCPDATWTCNNYGYCVAPNGAGQAPVDCTQVPASPWADFTQLNKTDLARNVACMAQAGTAGCGIEQQLRAGVRALERPDQAVFVRPGYLLAVMVVSDEEDCSMKTAGLFGLPEFDYTNQNINVVCNFPESNETNNLFDAKYFTTAW
jgi:hypothetical protein